MDDAGVKQAVAAFWQNDPYYPRPCPPGHPDAELWEIFEARYLHHSDKKLDSKAQGKNLARQFIDGVVAEAKRRASSEAGPPRDQPSRGGHLHGGASLSRIRIGTPPRGGLPQGGPPRGGFHPVGPSSSQSTAPSEELIQAQGRGGRRRGRGGSGRGGQGTSSFNIDDLA